MMPQFLIKIAGQVVAVTALYESTLSFCHDYLCDDPADFSVTVTSEDVVLERQKSAREDELEGLPIRNLPDELLERTALQRKIVERLFERDILLFHGSAVEVDGHAYLFTAKSGTGKSTHTGLWRQVLGNRVRMINDDKPFLQFEEDRILVCGSPWNGKHGLGSNVCVPLKAICILERGVQNRICSISAKDALNMLFQQSQRSANRQNLAKYMELIDRLVGQCEFYRMACNMDPEAALISFEAMSGRGKDEKNEN